jgi:hypothetical protein
MADLGFGIGDCGLKGRAIRNRLKAELHTLDEEAVVERLSRLKAELHTGLQR